MAWLADNIAWLLVLVGLAAVIGLIVYRLIKNKKNGKSSCGCACAGCAMRDACHSKSDNNGNGAS